MFEFNSRRGSGRYDVASRRGVRPSPKRIQGFDLGIYRKTSTGSWSNVWLFLPSLEPRVYRLVDRAVALAIAIELEGEGTRYDKPKGARIEIVGKNETAIWGRFVATTCHTADDCYAMTLGTFSGAIDTTESGLKIGDPRFATPDGGTGDMLCDQPQDCEPKGECGEASCSSRQCYFQSTAVGCGAGMRCDATGPKWKCVPE